MIKEKFFPKQLSLLSNSWQYENIMSEHLYNSTLEYAQGYDTYGEALVAIQESGPGYFQIDKIFINE